MPPGDDDAREPEGEVAAGAEAPRIGGQRIEVRELGLADDLDASRDDPLVVPGQREPVLLHARVPKGAVQPLLARHALQPDGEARLLGELSDG